MIPAARFLVKLARTINRFRALIWNALNLDLSNARSEATNIHLSALNRRACRYGSPDALIAMAMLTRRGLCPQLPGWAERPHGNDRRSLKRRSPG